MICQLGADDAAAWRDIRLEMLQTEPLAFGARYQDWHDRPLTDFAGWLDRVHMFGAVESKEILASAGWSAMPEPSEAHRGLIVAVYTRPAWRGQGLIDQLIQAICDHALGKVVQLELAVAARNPAALRAYARSGFKQTGTTPRALCHDGVYVDEITMVRPLDSA